MATVQAAVNPSDYPSLEAIVAAVSQGKLDVDTASALLARLQKSKPSRLYAKVSAKGALSVYGLQRMPVTLYVQQWERLLAFADELQAFMAAHKGELSVK